MGVLSNIKKQQYIKILEKLVKSKVSLKDIEEAYIAYKKFCYDNNLKDNYPIKNLIGEKTIIEITQDHTFIDDDKVALAVSHLREALKNNDGISMEEAEMILRWSVENTYHAIFESTSTNSISVLHTYDSFAQSISALPFIDAGVPITINDTASFSSNPPHSFITVKMPIQSDSGVQIKQFLIDVTYIAYFLLSNASFASFYEKYKSGPLAGFYMCQTEEGIEFATELLKNGYIELTPERARLYCTAFECEKLSISNWTMWREIVESNCDYMAIINNDQGELDYRSDNIDIFDMKIKFPELSKTKKYE